MLTQIAQTIVSFSQQCFVNHAFTSLLCFYLETLFFLMLLLLFLRVEPCGRKPSELHKEEVLNTPLFSMQKAMTFSYLLQEAIIAKKTRKLEDYLLKCMTKMQPEQQRLINEMLVQGKVRYWILNSQLQDPMNIDFLIIFSRHISLLLLRKIMLRL